MIFPLVAQGMKIKASFLKFGSGIKSGIGMPESNFPKPTIVSIPMITTRKPKAIMKLPVSYKSVYIIILVDYHRDPMMFVQPELS